ncbi:MAG TPA: TetR/AcrR family transcriptional regulator [Acidimicrobiales bacterium]|jgi:AcrR family transcriptional regulator|nr:TetR/AcrR family transcriptional regulator [Acidimicrobiales bacterium]
MPRLAATVRAARRERILRAALRCFARRGYHATTVDDIAAEAGVSKGAPYVYFESKEALFRALYETWECGLSDRLEAALARLEEGERRSPRRVLMAVVTAVGAHVAEQADLCRVLIEARTQAAYVGTVAEVVRASWTGALSRMARLVEAGVACGEWPPDTDPENQARLILAAIHGLMAEWHLRPGSFSWAEMARLLAGGRSMTDRAEEQDR